METSSLNEQTKIGSCLPLEQQQQRQLQHKHKHPYPFQRSNSSRKHPAALAVKGGRDASNFYNLDNVNQPERVTTAASSNSSYISHSSYGSSTCNDTYTTTGDKPLVCLQYMTHQLYEMANGVTLPASLSTTPRTPGEHHYQSSIISNCPWTDTVAKEATLLSTTLASAATSMMTSVTDNGSSLPTATPSPDVASIGDTDASISVGNPATPTTPIRQGTAIAKRRRKEDATASGGRRYSPEKQKRRGHRQHHLRVSLSPSGSLLDGPMPPDSRRRELETSRLSPSTKTSPYGITNDSVWMMDDSNDDDQSELEGDRIPLQQSYLSPKSHLGLSPKPYYHLPQQPPPAPFSHSHTNQQDDLSYTYSESEASPRPVATDLLRELIWEKLDDQDDDSDDNDDAHHRKDDHHSYGGESYDSSQEGLAATTTVESGPVMSPPLATRSSIDAGGGHSVLPRTPTGSLVGEVITVSDREQQGEQHDNARSTSLCSPKQQQKKQAKTPECRRVSDCSSIDSVSSSTSSSSTVCESVSLTSSQDQHSLSVSSSTSGTLSSAERSNDNGVVFDRHMDGANSKIGTQSQCTPSQHFQIEKRQGKKDGDSIQDIMYAQQKSSRKRTNKRKEQCAPSLSAENYIFPVALSPSRVHERNRARTDDYQNYDQQSFFLPLHKVFSVEALAGGSTLVTPKHMFATNADMEESSRQQQQMLHSSGQMNIDQNDESSETDASLLLDLTKDLKDIALYAGKSSGDLVSSLYHTLCEE